MDKTKDLRQKRKGLFNQRDKFDEKMKSLKSKIEQKSEIESLKESKKINEKIRQIYKE